MNTEKLRYIIAVIGEEQIERIYDVTGSEKVSFATLYKQILVERIKKRISSGHSIRQIAKEYCVSRMTVYRIFHRLRTRRG